MGCTASSLLRCLDVASPPPLPPPTLYAPADTGTPLTRASASTLACHTLLILARDAAGNNTAGDLLRTMYTAWLKQYRPQTWHAANASRVNWLASLAAIANHNILLANRYYTAPNQYTDLSPAEFTASVLMPATPQQAGTPATPARKLLARGSVSVPVPTYPLTINWMTAGKVSGCVGMAGPGGGRACTLAGTLASSFASRRRSCPLASCPHGPRRCFPPWVSRPCVAAPGPLPLPPPWSRTS